MTEPTDKLVRIECIVNPDVHLGDGRVLKGPVKEGTKTTKSGDVAEVDAALADMLVDNGQVKVSKSDITVLIEDTNEYKVEQAERLKAARAKR